MPNNNPADVINQLIATDPEIQSIIRGVWGNTTVDQRPSDTPKNLEKANSNASKAIKAVLDRRGIHLPSRTFVNPRTNSIEGMHGWAGLPTAAKLAIIGGAAAGGLGIAGMAGAFGGAAGGGAGAGAAGSAAVPSIGATGGLGGLSLPAVAGTTGGSVGAGALASTPLLSSATMPAASTVASAGNMGATMVGGGGFLGAIKNYGGRMLNNIIDDPEMLGRGLAGTAQAQANNRGAALDAMLAADQNRLAAAQDRRAEESDLWKKLQAADYMKSGGTPKPSTFTTASGKQLKMMDFGPKPISEGNKQMASTLEQQLMQRLNTPMQLHDYDSKMNPGIMEQINNYASPALTLYGGLTRKPAQPQGGLASATRSPQAPPVPGMPPPPGMPTDARGYVNDDDYTG